MPTIKELAYASADGAFREDEDYGNPASEPHEPDKAHEIPALFDAIQDAFDALAAQIADLGTQIQTGKGYPTIAAMNADIANIVANGVVSVYADPLGDVTDGNGYWIKISGVMEWQRPIDANLVTLTNTVAVIEPVADFLAFQRVVGGSLVASFGRVVGKRTPSGSFVGWRGTYPYANESFNEVWVYLQLPLSTSVSSVKLAIYEDSSTVEIATCTRLCKGSGYFKFKLNKTVVGADISTNFVRVGFWVTDGSGLLSPGYVRATVPSSGSNDQAFKTSAGGSWTTATEPFRPFAALVLSTSETSGRSAQDVALDESLIDTDQITASGVTPVGVLTEFVSGPASSSIMGYSSTQTKPVSFDANGIFVPSLRRLPSTAAAERWHTLTGVLRTGSSSGAIVATGQIIVDPMLDELDKVYIPFTDKSGAIVGVDETDIPDADMCVQIEAWTIDGAPATFTAPNGTIDIATASFFMTTSNISGWAVNAFTDYAIQLVNATFARAKKRTFNIYKMFQSEPPTCTLPATTYASVGKECQIYLRNLIAGDPKDYHWRVLTSGEGALREDAFVVTPGSTGDQTVTFYCHDKRTGVELASFVTTMKRTAANAKNGQSRVVNMAGDSLMAGVGSSPAVLPITLLRASATVGGATVTGIGGSGTGPDKYESFSGQTLSWLMTNGSSPYSSGGAFDFPAYMVAGSYATPDWVIMRFGANSISSYPALKAGALAEEDATRYIEIAANIRGTYASTKLGILIPPMPAGQDAFSLAVATKEWNSDYYKARMHEYQRTLMDRLAGLTASGIYLIPEHLALDTVNNFPISEPQLINAGIAVTGTYATLALMMADLTPAHGALYKVTNVGDGTAGYFVKQGPTAGGYWERAGLKDGIIQRQANAVHMQGSGYRQMNGLLWDWALVNL